MLLKSNQPCNKCGSSRGLAEYEDGEYCHACNESGNGEKSVDKKKLIEPNLIRCMALPLRKISQDTCEFFSYGVSKNKDGQYVHVEQYFDKYGDVRWQRLRTEDKKFTWLGDSVSDCPLFGQWLFTPGPNIDIIVVEGAIDAMSVSEAHWIKYKRRYPVVSICNGAGSSYKELSKAKEWLEGFKHIKLGLDADKDGRKAMEKCIDIFEPGKLSIIKWG